MTTNTMVLRKAYGRQKCHAEKRGIEFLLSFDEWLTIWAESGHVADRGRRRHQYVMARLGDVGSYKVGNVKIITALQNNYEQRATWTGRRHSAASRKKMSVKMTGNTNGRGNRGRVYSPATIERMRQSHLGKTRKRK